MQRPKFFVSMRNIWNPIDIDWIDHSTDDGITPALYSLISKDDRENNAIQFAIRFNPEHFVNMLSEDDIKILVERIAQRIGLGNCIEIINNQSNYQLECEA